jgi:hypothetical protein
LTVAINDGKSDLKNAPDAQGLARERDLLFLRSLQDSRSRIIINLQQERLNASSQT